MIYILYTRTQHSNWQTDKIRWYIYTGRQVERQTERRRGKQTETNRQGERQTGKRKTDGQKKKDRQTVRKKTDRQLEKKDRQTVR